MHLFPHLKVIMLAFSAFVKYKVKVSETTSTEVHFS